MGRTARRRNIVNPNQYRIDQLKYKINKYSDILHSNSDLEPEVQTKLREELAYCSKMMGFYLKDSNRNPKHMVRGS